jgi:hypothetical protein
MLVMSDSVQRHPKATPVILTSEANIELWMRASAQDALKLQRPPLDGDPKIVATGEGEPNTLD